MLVRLLPPSYRVSICKTTSVRKFLQNPEHAEHYLLCFCFYNHRKEEVGNLSMIFDLGVELLDEAKTTQDIYSLSVLASTQLSRITFKITNHEILVTLTLMDNNPMYKFLTKTLDYQLNNLEIQE